MSPVYLVHLFDQEEHACKQNFGTGYLRCSTYSNSTRNTLSTYITRFLHTCFLYSFNIITKQFSISINQRRCNIARIVVERACQKPCVLAPRSQKAGRSRTDLLSREYLLDMPPKRADLYIWLIVVIGQICTFG